jgi:iron(III) transport system substrate-binding protein
MKKVRLAIPLLIMILTLSCSQEGEEVNIYSGRHYQVDEDLYQKFTEETGIEVNLIKAGADQLINRLEMEGENTRADLLITADAGRLILAKEKGLLQPMNTSDFDDVVPEYLIDSEKFWTGFTMRARVLVYQKERVDPSELSTYEDLGNDKWDDRILVRSSQNHYNQTLMASLIAHLGEEAATQWAESVVENMAREPEGNDRDQVKAVAAGLGDIAIVNTYYMGLLLNSSNAEEVEVAKQMGVFFPNQQGRGTHVNVSGIAITQHASNKENAQKLIDFLLEQDAQSAFTNETYEYPANSTVEYAPLLNEWGDFKKDTLPLDELTRHIEQSMVIFNNAGWK